MLSAVYCEGRKVTLINELMGTCLQIVELNIRLLLVISFLLCYYNPFEHTSFTITLDSSSFPNENSVKH